MKNICIILVSIFVLSGCFKAGKDYVRPEAKFDETWDTIQNTPSQNLIKKDEKLADNNYWWKNFKDNNLSTLIEQSFEYNHDLKIAEARIKEAVANERAAFAGLFPEIGLSGSFDRSKSGPASGNIVDRSTRGGLNGSWDIDIFGSNRRRQEAAKAGIGAAESERDRIMLAIIAEVARNYVRLRRVKQQQKIIEDNITIQEGTLNATKTRRAAGAVSDLEVTRAEAQVESTKSLLPQVKAEGAIAINRLHALTGESNHILREIAAENAYIPYIENEVVVSTPVNVINNRPDVLAAERNLAAATALTGAAIADMFPKLSLQGFFGAAESNVFGAGNPWNVAANGLFPLLNFGRLKMAVKAADARQEQALAEYQKTIVLALEEIENNFSNYINEQDRMYKLANVLKKRKRVTEISKEQYKAGAITQLDLLVAQQNQLDAENELVTSEANVASHIISLYQSMGVSDF